MIRAIELYFRVRDGSCPRNHISSGIGIVLATNPGLKKIEKEDRSRPVPTGGNKNHSLFKSLITNRKQCPPP